MMNSSKLQNVKSTTQGFTLVELLIVIVVVAILASISVIAYNGVQGRATTSALKSNVNTLIKKIEQYRIENDQLVVIESYPPCPADPRGESLNLLQLPEQLIDKLCVSASQFCDDGAGNGVRKDQICFFITSGMNAGSSWYVTIAYWDSTLDEWKILSSNMDLQNPEYDSFSYTPRSGGSGTYPDPNFGTVVDD